MTTTFLNHNLCDTKLFDETRNTEKTTLACRDDLHYINLHKTVKLAADRLHMPEPLPNIIVHDHQSAAFTASVGDKKTPGDIHITRGLYDGLSNDQLRAVLLLQTCLLHHQQTYDGKYHVSNVTLAGTSMIAGAFAGKAYKDSQVKEETDAPKMNRAQFMKKLTNNAITFGALGSGVVGAALGKQVDKKEERRDWIQAAVADYAALNDDADKSKLVGALMKMHFLAAPHETQEKNTSTRNALDEFLQTAFAAEPNKSIIKLPPTSETRFR